MLILLTQQVSMDRSKLLDAQVNWVLDYGSAFGFQIGPSLTLVRVGHPDSIKAIMTGG